MHIRMRMGYNATDASSGSENKLNASHWHIGLRRLAAGVAGPTWQSRLHLIKDHQEYCKFSLLNLFFSLFILFLYNLASFAEK